MSLSATDSMKTGVWMLGAVISVGGLTAHFYISTALILAPASIVAPLEFLRLPLIAVIGNFVYAEALSLFILGGAILIIGANIANLRKAETR